LITEPECLGTERNLRTPLSWGGEEENVGIKKEVLLLDRRKKRSKAILSWERRIMGGRRRFHRSEKEELFSTLKSAESQRQIGREGGEGDRPFSP